MDLEAFVNKDMGELVDIRGEDPVRGTWTHSAFIPVPLTDNEPQLTGETYRLVSAAGRALAALDATADRLPNPYLFRSPALRREAQATSALEGTFAPLESVFTADEDAPGSAEMVEILNYVAMANMGFSWLRDRRPFTVGLLEALQGRLMRATPVEAESGHIRTGQVVIGKRTDIGRRDVPVHAARFIPAPAGDQLRAGVDALVQWMSVDHSQQIDPVIAAGMAHYQFETLHPFRDGNGRLGRFLIVLSLVSQGILHEPTLTVSPWFEKRRTEYYDALFGVSTRGDWDTFLAFFARGLVDSAMDTQRQMLALVGVHEHMKERVGAAGIRSAKAMVLVDLAVANPSFTMKRVCEQTGLTHAGATRLVGQLVECGVLTEVNPHHTPRYYAAPAVLDVLLRPEL
ncbi:Fic/DOC family N-terminal domain-containing protein [Schaalia sp. ZJ1691]|uniref:Fic family protein n=1 Tax=Schaalia sp. ZJ1691 TaxID=2709404 RepID=UPI00197E468D|nr:Fic/DOC family N-terminal domain-containing protein [Schaalia sp. ZJ1691]